MYVLSEDIKKITFFFPNEIFIFFSSEKISVYSMANFRHDEKSKTHFFSSEKNLYIAWANFRNDGKSKTLK